MLNLLRSLWSNRRLIREFVGRDLKARYVGSSMGFFWSVIVPVISLFVYMFVFRLVLNTRWGDGASEGDTALVMLAGILAWSAFAESVSRATNSLVENANLIQKVVFPSEILTPYLVISSLINMLIGIPVVLMGLLLLDSDGTHKIMFGFHPERFSLCLLALPLLVVLQGMLSLGLGYFLSVLNLFLRDVYHVVGVLVVMWMFATPIFYPDFLVDPDIWVQRFHLSDYPSEAAYLNAMPKYDFGWVLTVNPMYWLIEAYRDVLLRGHWPSLRLFQQVLLPSIALIWLGSKFFMRHKPTFPDLL